MIKSEKKIEFSGKRELTKTNNRSLIIASGINVFVDKGVAEATGYYSCNWISIWHFL